MKTNPIRTLLLAVSFLALALAASAQVAPPAIRLNPSGRRRAAAAIPAVPAPAPAGEADGEEYEDLEDDESESKPWYAFWRRSADAEEEDAAEEEEPVETPWTLELDDGTVHSVLPSSLSFKLDTLPETTPFSPERFSCIDVTFDPLSSDESGVLHATLRNVRFALEAPLPRTLRAETADGERVSVPWNTVRRLFDTAPGAAADIRHSMPAPRDVQVVFDDDPAPVPAQFPIAFLPFKTERAAFAIPSWHLLSVVVNPDRTCTLRSRYGDVLTGTVPLKRIPGFENASSIVFRVARGNGTIPSRANLYRLVTGDVLAAVPAAEAAPVAPAASSSLRAALAANAAASAEDASLLVSPLLDLGTVLELPADFVESVTPLRDFADPERPMPPLPPAAKRPHSPSARVTDEVFVPAATFHLGSAAPNAPANESPSVAVTLDPFWIASAPVTVAQYASFIDDSGYRPKPEARSWDTPGFPQSPNDPVVAVSWRDAVAYCNWLSKKARLDPAYVIPSDDRLPVVFDPEADGYRLPLEAEWELVARNLGKPVSFPWGDDADEAAAVSRANFAPMDRALSRSWPFTSPVKSFPANDLGVYDLAGNVAEWCQDAYAPDAYGAFYKTGNFAPLLNPSAPTYRVIRGGSWLSPLPALRTTARAYGLELVGVPNGDPPRPRVGFRVARNAPVPPPAPFE